MLSMHDASKDRHLIRLAVTTAHSLLRALLYQEFA